MRIIGLCILLAMILSSSALAARTDVISYPRPLSSHDSRFEYHLSLLRQALERTVDEYGPFELRATTVKMNQLRQFDMLRAGSPILDVAIKPTSIDREKKLTPVRIPLDKGLLGWRMLLIHRDNEKAVDQIRDLEDLQRFVIGQGLGWTDIEILRRNGLKVVEGGDYEGLFKMLMSKRFDIFPRGISEAYAEWDERHAMLPDLAVDQVLLLHYPFARYFWTASSERGKKLNERITKGLEKMLRDGSFDAAFEQHYGRVIRRARLDQRRLIELKNPDLPPDTPLERKELWFTPGVR